MGTVPRKPSEVKQVDFAMDELVAVLQRAVRTRVDEAAPFEAVENEALAITDEMVRRFVEQTLQQIAADAAADRRAPRVPRSRSSGNDTSVTSLEKSAITSRCGPVRSAFATNALGWYRRSWPWAL